MIVVHGIPDWFQLFSDRANADVLTCEFSRGDSGGPWYSVYARIVPLRVVADLVGCTVRLAWRKLGLRRGRRRGSVHRRV